MSGDTTCARCDQPNPVWFAPDDLWNAVEGADVWGILCPACFAEMAEDSFLGHRVVWRFEPDSIGAEG